MDSSIFRIAILVVLAVIVAMGAVIIQHLQRQLSDYRDIHAKVSDLESKVDRQALTVRNAAMGVNDTRAELRRTANRSRQDEYQITVDVEETLANQQAQIQDLTETVDHLQLELARALTGLRNAPPDPDEQTAIESRMTVPLPQEIEHLQAKLMEPDSSITDRLIVLRRLRMADARSDDVANYMAQTYYQTNSAKHRADIFRQLDGVVTPTLRTALLDAIANDEDADVREEAAETMEHYLPDEEVQQWLQYAADNDPDRDVRLQASQSLQQLREVAR